LAGGACDALTQSGGSGRLPTGGKGGVMKESTTYQYIHNEGQVLGMQRAVLQQGRLRFGEPDSETETAVRSITDLQRLDRLLARMITASSRREMLATR
jgi:hypothetical protein